MCESGDVQNNPRFGGGGAMVAIRITFHSPNHSKIGRLWLNHMCGAVPSDLSCVILKSGQVMYNCLCE